MADVRDIAGKAASQNCKLALILRIAVDRAMLRDPASEIGAGSWAAGRSIGL